MLNSSGLRMTVAVALTGTVLACSSRTNDTTADSAGGRNRIGSDSADGAPPTDTVTARATRADGLTAADTAALPDTSLVRLLATVDKGEIEVARLAIDSSTHQGTRDFGRLLLSGHSRDLDALTSIFPALQLQRAARGSAAARQRVPALPRVSQGDSTQGMRVPFDTTTAVGRLQQAHARTMSSLRMLHGADFDRGFADAMVAGHEHVLTLLRAQRTPPTSGALAKHVPAAAAMIETHLERARALRTSLAMVAVRR